MGSAGDRMERLSGELPATEGAHAASAHGPNKYSHQSGWNCRLGVLPVGLWRDRGRAALLGTGANDTHLREAKQPLGDCPQPHFSGAIGKPLGHTTQGAAPTGQAFVTPAWRWPQHHIRCVRILTASILDRPTSRQ